MAMNMLRYVMRSVKYIRRERSAAGTQGRDTGRAVIGREEGGAEVGVKDMRLFRSSNLQCSAWAGTLGVETCPWGA